MSRKLLFRGQTRKLGEKVTLSGEPLPGKWVYGGIFQGSTYSVIYGNDKLHFTSDIHKYCVYSDTVCQYTGYNDALGQPIYEGDIVLHLGTGYLAVVKWNDTFWVLFFFDEYYDEELCRFLGSEFEVKGNIFDNPELLEY